MDKDQPAVELLPIARTLSVMLTHKCNAQCANCGTLSGPKVKGRSQIADVISAIDQASGNGFVNVVFTGGEPTIYFEDLLTGISAAAARKLRTRVVTNGGWCKTPERAVAKLSKMVDAGLDEINFSTGDEHQRFVPVDHVVNGLVAALDRKLPVHLMVEKTKKRSISKSNILSHPALAEHARRDDLGISESPWMPLDPYTSEEYEEGTTANAQNLPQFGGCDSVLQTYVLHPANEMSACCGIGSRIIPELRTEEDFNGSDCSALQRTIAEAEMDVLKLWLREEGPEHILAWTAAIDPSITWEGIYAHRCQACARLYMDPKVRRVIAEHYMERLPDVLAKAHMFEYPQLQPHGGS